MPTLLNPALFPEPHVFKPERHLDSRGQFVRNDCLITFGIGKLAFCQIYLSDMDLDLHFYAL